MIQLNHTYSGLVFRTWIDGVPADADELPTGAVYRNGSLEAGVTVTIGDVGAGKYHASFTTDAGWAVTDHVYCEVACLLNGVSYPKTVFDSVGVQDASVAAVQTEVNKIPRVGETHHYDNGAGDEADVTISVP